MVIGVPKEIKNNENRVSITPAGVYELVNRGHKVVVQKDAGAGSGFTNEEYVEAGAHLGSDAGEVFAEADMIVKVKEYLESEFKYLRQDQMVFTYLHIASNLPFTNALLASKTTGIAYETIQGEKGGLPLLAPMSEVAGRMSVQIGAYLLQKGNGGRGVLLGGVSGVLPAKVTVVGGGVVGLNAARMAAGLGADVTIFDLDASRMAYINDVSQGQIHTQFSNAYNLKAALKDTDLLIGAVLIPGAKAPKLVTEDMVKGMKPGSVIVDVAIDQGGCVETIDRVTTHDEPYYVKHDVIHYSVANMPGAVARTSTIALSSNTLPYILKLADGGVEALKQDDNFLLGLNTYDGKITYRGVAEAHQMQCADPKKVL